MKTELEFLKELIALPENHDTKDIERLIRCELLKERVAGTRQIVDTVIPVKDAK